MKRLIPFLLCTALLLALPSSARAEGDDRPDWSIRTSVHGPCASMAVYRDLFAEAEQFGADAPLTRAMTAVILARHAGAGEAAASSRYSDVPAGSWYAFAADWCGGSDILPAAIDGLFHGDEAMTRESLCQTLRNYLACMEQELVTINAWYSFLDAGTMSRDGRQAAALMQEAGVLIEEHDGFFYPSRQVTVAEAETVFLRFFAALRQDRFQGMPVSTVVESAPVDDAWFGNACFIGHSQVVGMSRYFSMTNAGYYCAVGFKAQDMLDFAYFQGPNKRYGTLDKIFHNYEGTYKKIYIMLGINDCNSKEGREEKFLTPMRELLDLIRETQPDATIYLLSLAPVGRETPMNTSYNPENVMYYCQMLKSLSREYDTEYLDIFRLMADGEGYIRDEFNDGDGIHIKAKQYPVLEEYIRCHTGS